MDFKVKKDRVEVNELSEQYPFDVQMYTDLSEDLEVSLNEFEEFAIERVKVLRTLEQISLKEQFTNFDDYKIKVVASLNQQGLNIYKKLILHSSGDDVYEARRRDHISHFMLRLVYCQNEEYRKFFVTREWDLFKLRWVDMKKEAKKAFLKTNCMNVTPLDENEVACLNESSGGFIRTTGEYYSVKWIEITELVRTRKIYLERGLAYISSDDLIHVLSANFKSNLSHTLTIMSHRYQLIEEDERLRGLVNKLHNAYVGKSYVSNDSNRTIPLQSLDIVSKAFPLCMKQLYSTLKIEHHLKHTARQHLGLFLKGIGLPLEDALTFWKREFTKKMDVDQFDKKYAYNIRFNYGKEGKRTNYTPYSCIKILNSTPGPGEFHGCPFKHNDIQNLRQTFTSMHISQPDINEILQFRNMNQFQLACAKYFEVTQKAPLLVPMNHPNQYFEEVQKLGNMETLVPPSKNYMPSTSSNENETQSEEQKKLVARELLSESEIIAMDWGDDTL